MSEELLNTKEVARYLGIHEKQVYALVKAGRIPATKITGKWTFPKSLLAEWLEADARAGLELARQKGRRMPGAVLAAGSNDPVLELLLSFMRRSHPEFYVFTANIGSTEGLKAMNLGYTDVAWSHLYDPESGDYNTPFLARLLPKARAVVVNLFHRDLGLVSAPGNPLGIGGFGDLARPGIRLINRQPGAGTRLLLDRQLESLGIPGGRISGYDNEASTHYEVGLAVLSGEADTGLATRAVSSLLGLHFVPVIRERFDMVVEQAAFFEPGLQALIESLGSPEFRGRAERLGNYDFSQSGKILHSTHSKE